MSSLLNALEHKSQVEKVDNDEVEELDCSFTGDETFLEITLPSSIGI